MLTLVGFPCPFSGRGGNGHQLQALPALGVPGYYWGTNCLHSLNGGYCVNNSKGEQRCPTNFPSGPSFGATFDRDLIHQMANAIGVELRASMVNGMSNPAAAKPPSLDCWGPVVNLNRDPRWGRNGEGGTEDAYAMGELAAAWTHGFQAPRPSKSNPDHMLYQGIITLKHMAVNSLENTFPWTRHNFDANETFGVRINSKTKCQKHRHRHRHRHRRHLCVCARAHVCVCGKLFS